MSDEKFGLSRRKLIGAVGTIGGAATLGGAGSMAYFSDEEEFANNRLVAGDLDLKVDWEEHYSDWSEDESEGVGEVVMTDGDPTNVPAGYVGLPDPATPLLAVPSEDLGTFMDNTAVEAYPDTDDDGVQEPFAQTPGETTPEGVGYICEDGADTPEDLDPDGGTGLRTTKGPDSPRGEATVDIEDVKPGDFGELTLSYHLCTNDGFVWLQADDVGSAENGYTEPERKDEDETGDADGDGQDDTTELLDEIQTTWWYDTDGDNVLDSGAEGGGEGGQADVVVVFDRSGSMGFEAGKLQSAKDGAKALVDAAGSGVNLGLVPFNTTASVTEPLGSPRSEIKTTIDGLTASGGTDIAEAINDAQAEIDANGRAGVPNFIVLLTNGVSSPGPAGSAADTAKAAGTTIYGIAYGSGADEALIEEVSSPPKNDDGDIDDVDEFAWRERIEHRRVGRLVGIAVVHAGDARRVNQQVGLDVLGQRRADGVRRVASDGAPHHRNVTASERFARPLVVFRRRRCRAVVQGRDQQPGVQPRDVDAELVQLDFVGTQVARRVDILASRRPAADDDAEFVTRVVELLDHVGVASHARVRERWNQHTPTDRNDDPHWVAVTAKRS
jgi:predicted ribosomally synthesized peptide with SipW-like signal peptide